MSCYRFLTRPGWIIFSVVVVLLVILMVNLSAWQFRRLHERRSFNAEVQSRTSAAAEPFDTVDPPGHDRRRRPPRGVEDGRPSPARSIHRPRSSSATARSTPPPATTSLTPLKRADGTAVLVVRGWVPLSTSNSTTPDVPPAVTGTVTVEGRVRPTQNPGALASRDPAEGVLPTLARIDIPRIQQQTAYPHRAGLRGDVVLVAGAHDGPPGTGARCPSSTTAPTSATPCSGSSSPSAR